MLTERQQLTITRLKKFNHASTPREIIDYCQRTIIRPVYNKNIPHRKTRNHSKEYFNQIINHFTPQLANDNSSSKPTPSITKKEEKEIQEK